jgi:hypothetical protein
LAEGVLGERGRVGVVGHVDRQGERSREVAAEGDVVPAQVGRFDDDAVVVDDARAADADPDHGAVGAGGELPSELDGEVHGGLTDPAATGDRAAVEHLAGQVDDGAVHVLVGAEVDRDDVPGVGHDADERRRLAHALTLPPPDLLDESLLEQPGDEVRRRWWREVRGAGEVGAAQGAVTQERLQDEAPVVAPGVLRQRLRRRPERPLEGARTSPVPHSSFLYLPNLLPSRPRGGEIFRAVRLV